jgi:hypothetical protein
MERKAHIFIPINKELILKKNDPEGVQQRKVVGGLNSGEGHV